MTLRMFFARCRGSCRRRLRFRGRRLCGRRGPTRRALPPVRTTAKPSRRMRSGERPAINSAALSSRVACRARKLRTASGSRAERCSARSRCRVSRLPLIWRRSPRAVPAAPRRHAWRLSWHRAVAGPRSRATPRPASSVRRAIRLRLSGF